MFEPTVLRHARVTRHPSRVESPKMLTLCHFLLAPQKRVINQPFLEEFRGKKPKVRCPV